MSARHVIEHALRVYYADSRDPKGTVEKLLAMDDAAYAHELAEKVMALRSTVPALKARQLFKDGYDAALMVAAFTISEEVSDSGA